MLMGWNQSSHQMFGFFFASHRKALFTAQFTYNNEGCWLPSAGNLDALRTEAALCSTDGTCPTNIQIQQRVRVSMNIYCKSAKTAAALHEGDKTVEIHCLHFLKNKINYRKVWMLILKYFLWGPISVQIILLLNDGEMKLRGEHFPQESQSLFHQMFFLYVKLIFGSRHRLPCLLWSQPKQWAVTVPSLPIIKHTQSVLCFVVTCVLPV